MMTNNIGGHGERLCMPCPLYATCGPTGRTSTRQLFALRETPGMSLRRLGSWRKQRAMKVVGFLPCNRFHPILTRNLNLNPAVSQQAAHGQNHKQKQGQEKVCE
jgi:hypothetical protein